MEIIKSSTTEVSFLVRASEASVYEKDFILIIDINKTPQKMHLAQVEKLIQTKEGEINGLAIILGEIDPNDFSLSPCRFPLSSDSTIKIPPKGWVSKIMSYRGNKGIYLGDIITSRNSSDPFLISPDFLERHVLCVASTGAGKSYSVGVLLEEILLKFKSAAVLLFDIHNEYWGLACPNDGKEVEKLNHENHEPQGFRNNLLVFEKESLGLGTHFDLPKLRRLLDLTSAQENSLLNILEQSYLLSDLIPLIQESNIHSATRENLILKINSLINMKLFDKELDFEKLTQPGQISIVRLDQYVDERKRKLLVNEILNQLFDKKLSGEIAREHEIVIVVEEAHRFAAESEILSTIAREGRKFGLYEILISQRPGDLPDNIIANMNTLISLRIRSDKDINKIRLMEGISTETVSVLPHLSRGEALIVGLQKGTNRPIKIRIRPRLSKHIDPQEDQMPNDIPRYKLSTDSKKILDSEEIISSVLEEDEESGITKNAKPFNYKDLINLLTCKHILILHKQTGICIFELGMTMLAIDPQLVSGFLTAISGLFSELKEGKPVKERTIVRIFTEEIGDRAFEIVTVEGNFSITAIIMDRIPKYIDRLKKRIREFIYVFEKEFQPYLTEFVGVIDYFLPTIHTLDQFIGLSLMSPLKLNEPYNGIIHHPNLYEIIIKQKGQLAESEGLFIEEIVNQCLLDSDYNYKEIAEAIILFLQEGIISLKDSNRSLPSFTSSFVQKKPETAKFVNKEISEISLPSMELKEEGETKEREIFELNIVDVNWFLQLISEIMVAPLPDSLKKDILERDLIFESNLRLKSKSIIKETYNEYDLNRWAKLQTQRGFKLDYTTPNPVNGVKLILKTETQKIICSIAKLSNKEFFIMMGEVY